MQRFKRIILPMQGHNKSDLHWLYNTRSDNEPPLIFSYSKLKFWFNGTSYRSSEKLLLYVQIPSDIIGDIVLSDIMQKHWEKRNSAVEMRGKSRYPICVALWVGKNRYTVKGVTYTVRAVFDEPNQVTLRDRFEKIIRTGSAHLTIPEKTDKIKSEEYDPTVGKENNE